MRSCDWIIYYGLVWIGLWFHNGPSIAKVIGAGLGIGVDITVIGFRAGPGLCQRPGPARIPITQF
jgi:hypothetical protein